MKITWAIVWILLLMWGDTIFGQETVSVELGARAGIPFIVPLESQLTGGAAVFSSYAFERSQFSVGPAITGIVLDRVAIEFDAIYKPIRFTSSLSSPFTLPVNTTHASSWEFPLIADYRFLGGPVRPYGGAGILLGQSISGTTDSRVTDLRTGTVTTSSASFGTFFTQLPAYVINGGLEWRTSRVVIRPELRYTRWSPVGQSEAAVRPQNQFEYSLGFSFKAFGR